MAQVATEPDKYEIFADIVIIGAGACGLVAALAAREEANADASIPVSYTHLRAHET